MHGAMGALKSIGPYVIGQIVGYIERKQTIERELFSLRRWHVLHVMTGHEAKVARKIGDELGLGTYIPIESYLGYCGSVQLGRRVWKMRPIYPGYVFVGFDPAGHMWKLLDRKDDERIDGVIRLLMIDERPIQIDEDTMGRIREVEAMKLNHRAVVPMVVGVGAAVRVVDYGAFTGLFSSVVEVDHDGRRVRVNLPFAGGEAPLWLAEGQFEVL